MIGRADCGRHAAVLFDLVDGGGPAAAEVEAALRHLDACGRCRRDLEEVAPVVARLRRLGAATRGRTPARDAWPAVVHSIDASPRRRRRPIFAWLSGPLGGVIAMPLVAALLLTAVGPRLAVGELAATPILSETAGLPAPSGQVPAGARIPHDREPGSAAYLPLALAWATGQQTQSSVPSARPALRAEQIPPMTVGSDQRAVDALGPGDAPAVDPVDRTAAARSR